MQHSPKKIVFRPNSPHVPTVPPHINLKRLHPQNLASSRRETLTQLATEPPFASLGNIRAGVCIYSSIHLFRGNVWRRADFSVPECCEGGGVFPVGIIFHVWMLVSPVYIALPASWIKYIFCVLHECVLPGV